MATCLENSSLINQDDPIHVSGSRLSGEKQLCDTFGIAGCLHFLTMPASGAGRFFRAVQRFLWPH